MGINQTTALRLGYCIIQFSLLTLIYGYVFFCFFNFQSMLGFYLGFHILILDPFVKKVVELKQCEPLEIIYTLKDPMIIKHLITGLVYPYVFLLIFGLFRYYALGKTFTPYYVSWDITYFLYLLFFSLHIFLILFRIKTYISRIKKYYLQDTYLVTYSLHLYFLRNFYYRMLVEKIHRYWHAFHVITWKNSAIYPSFYKKNYGNPKKNTKTSIFLNIINFLNFNPQVFSLFVCLFFIIEILYNNNIYYSSYLLFYYFLLDLLVTGIYKVGCSSFTLDCCYSNYLNEKSWDNPYFPHLFATFCNCPDYPYTYIRPTVKEIPEDVLLRLEELEEKANKEIKIKRDWYRKLRFAVLNTDANVFQRAKLAFHDRNYMSWSQHKMYAKNQKRFVHTNSTCTKLHPSTPFFFTKPVEKLALIKKAPNWVALHTQIQMLEKVKTTQGVPPEYSPHLHETIVEQQPSSVLIRDLEEYNLKTSFNPLAEAGVCISSHKEPYDYKKQPAPDIRADFSKNWKYPFKSIIGVDQKASPQGIGCNNIISVPQITYESKLRYLEALIDNEYCVNDDQRRALNLLKACKDDHMRKEIWASVLHLFPIHKIPPINTNAMIDDSNFTRGTRDEFKLAEKEIENMSKRLYTDFPNQRNRNWVELTQSAKELSTAKSPDFSVSQETLNMVLEFMSK